MISFNDALQVISTKVQTRLESGARATETLSLDAALGRYCARNVTGEENFPARATSAMDGYAIRSGLTTSASAEKPVSFLIVGQIAAGDRSPIDSREAVAWEIMTGAILPDGFDACVRLEDVTVENSDAGVARIVISRPLVPGTNIRHAAEDFQQGALLLSPGDRVRSEDILCLATLGVQTIEVYRKPRVAIIATGKELLPSTQANEDRTSIRNSTTPFLLAALRERGADATFLGAVSDDPAAFNQIFAQADTGAFDLILTTGALSVGRHDFLVAALTDQHTEIYFRKVAIRPGKPVLFAETARKTFLIGLPGNPIASVVGLRFFVDHFLRIWFGAHSEQPWLLPLADVSLAKPADVTSFFRASVSYETGQVKTHMRQKAALLAPLLQTDVWIEVPAGVDHLTEGCLVSVWPFMAINQRRSGSANF